MNGWKRSAALLMAAMMLLSITGCGGKKDKETHTHKEKEMYVSVDKDGHKTVVDKDGKAITEFSFDKDGNIIGKDGKIAIPAEKAKNLPKPPAKLDGKSVYVSTDKDGKKQVVDESGKPVEGYTVDESGNISDASGKTVVDSNDVTAPPAKQDSSSSNSSSSSDNSSSSSNSGSSSGSSSSSSSSGSGSSSGSSSSGSSSSGSSSSGGNSNSGGSSSGGSSSGSGSGSSSGGGSTPAPAPAPAPDPEPAPEPEPPAHVHSFDIPVYRTETVEVTKTVYASYCDDCGQIFVYDDPYTGEACRVMSSEEMSAHSKRHALNGESGRRKTGNRDMTFTEERQVIDHYECSCGAVQ